jgi:hypothetical protein
MCSGNRANNNTSSTLSGTTSHTVNSCTEVDSCGDVYFTDLELVEDCRIMDFSVQHPPSQYHREQQQQNQYEHAGIVHQLRFGDTICYRTVHTIIMMMN